MKHFIIGEIEIERIRIDFTSCYLITTPNCSILIDSGPFKSRTIIERTFLFSTIDYLVITHSHYDHAGNGIYFKEKGIPIIAHKNAAEFLKNGKTPAPPGMDIIGKVMIKFSFLVNFSYPPFEPDIVFENHYRLCKDIELLYTPGHTPDSLSVIVGGKIAFVGDLMMHLFWRTWTYLPLFAHNPSQVIESIRLLKDKGITLFFPAHGRFVRI